MALITLATFTLPQDLAIPKSKLESEGIECFTFNELTVQVDNFMSNAIGGVELKVKEEDFSRAKLILEEDFNMKVNLPQAKWFCPYCNSSNIGAKGIHGKISLFILMTIGIPIPVLWSKFYCYDCDKRFKLKKG